MIEIKKYLYSLNTKSGAGFTLIELLVVIAIIGLLASVVLVALGNSRIKARDARRVADMHQIVVAINLFYDQYGCLPIPTVASTSACPGKGSYTGNDGSGWDYSSQPAGSQAFLTFLQDAGFMSKVPQDPINNMTGDATPGGTYAYQYYCYASGTFGPSLGYWRESDNQHVLVLSPATTLAGSAYICK